MKIFIVLLVVASFLQSCVTRRRLVVVECKKSIFSSYERCRF